jgi:hypothetical protein
VREKLVELAREVTAAHREYLEHDHDHACWPSAWRRYASRFLSCLSSAPPAATSEPLTFAAGLLAEYDALWTFEVPDAHIDPTNNIVERAMRHLVLMRQVQGGSQPERGNRWVERIQVFDEACRWQDRRSSTGLPPPPRPPTAASRSPRWRRRESRRKSTHHTDTP